MPLDTDPLMWYTEHVQEFPRLDRLTRQYLTVSTTPMSQIVDPEGQSVFHTRELDRKCGVGVSLVVVQCLDSRLPGSRFLSWRVQKGKELREAQILSF